MKPTLGDLQESVQDRAAFDSLSDYYSLTYEFLSHISRKPPTRIVSPSTPNYIFFQFDKRQGHQITRPLNSDLFIESPSDFRKAFERFTDFLEKLKKKQAKAVSEKTVREYLSNKGLSKIVYTMQQSLGSISDSFAASNQSRKRVGQIFEQMITLIIEGIGIDCEPRTIKLPIPGHDGYEMSYELDLVFSRDKALIAHETKYLHKKEVVGSVKTTSKDRIDKIFLDKFLLSKLLGRDIPVVAIFLHDVQRAQRGESIFGINSTFKTNHFLGYTVALNKLDGVYYVDPRPEMFTNERLREQISDFQSFLSTDIWKLSK